MPTNTTINAGTGTGTVHPTHLHDAPVDIKVKLSGIWVAMLFLFAYVDIFGFYRADIIEGALAGEIAGPGVTINQGFLAAAVGYIVIPCLMIVASLMTPARINRRLNVGVSIVYAVTIAGLCIGESWIYYLIGSFFEVVLLLLAARIAWRWPAQSMESMEGMEGANR